MRDFATDFNGHCVAAHCLADAALFAMADGTIRGPDDEGEGIRAHSALLAAAPMRQEGALLSGGEDGRVCRTSATGDVVEVARVPRKWITSVAAAASGNIAWSSGRSVWLRSATGEIRELPHKRSVRAIALSADGTRLAVAQQDWIAIHAASKELESIELQWSGTHSALVFSPDARYLLVATQDNALHGWRLQDRQHMRMVGYQARVGDWSWSADGALLATSGAASAIVWPFDGSNGPIGRTAIELGKREGNVVTAVACHPTDASLAIGYSDGALQVAGFDASPATVVRPGGRGAVTSMSWHKDGRFLVFGSALGECGAVHVAR